METNERKYYLVRTEKDLIDKSLVGIGWSEVDFSKHADAESAIKEIEEKYGTVGRSGNQIRRFFQIVEGDVVIVPLPWRVAIGFAGKQMFYDQNWYERDRANHRNITFTFDEKNNVHTIPRSSFSEAFQRRLRVQGMTVNDISEFKNEIEHAISMQEDGQVFSWNNSIQDELLAKEEDFKKELLKKIQNGQTNLQSGGCGLENLVEELLIAEGYKAVVLSKRAFSGFADADVKASKSDKFSSVDILVQVKHHQNTSGDWGIRQLEEINNSLQDENTNFKLVFLTSAAVSEELRAQAESKNITVIDGVQLVDWIHDNLHNLREDTKAKLGICETPTLISLYLQN